MIKIKVPPEIREASAALNDKCPTYNRLSGGNGSKEERLTGFIGQNMIRLMLGQPLMEATDTDDGKDGILSNGQTYDVKTMTRSVDVKEEWTNNFDAEQAKFSPDLYIFCSYNKVTQELTVCGYLPKEELREKSRFKRAGEKSQRADGTFISGKGRDRFEIDNDRLYNAKDLPFTGEYNAKTKRA